MGFEVDMKLMGYEEVIGVDPRKLLEDNLWWCVFQSINKPHIILSCPAFEFLGLKIFWQTLEIKMIKRQTEKRSRGF